MNTVHIKLNSYKQEVQLRINGKQPSPYSELSDFTFLQILEAPEQVFEAVERELNDDFDLLVTGNAFEVERVKAAADRCESCLSFREIPAALSLSTQQRAEMLKDYLTPTTLSFVVAPGTEPIADIHYGNVTVRFTTDQNADSNLNMGLFPKEIVVAAYESFVLNPQIGRIAESIGETEKEYLLLSRIDPFTHVKLPSTMEVGETAEAVVSVIPGNAEAPTVVLQSDDPDVLQCDGLHIKAVSYGKTAVYCYIDGDSRPFASNVVEVSKVVYAETLKFNDIDEPILIGTSVDLHVTAYPADATDVGSVVYETSDPAVAEIEGDSLIPKAAGNCTITAKGKRASCQKTVAVVPGVEAVVLDPSEVTLNIGQKVPVKVCLQPENAYSRHRGWSVGDETVADIVVEDGVEYIKAIGIGETEIFRIETNARGTIVDACCKVTVKSMMYSNQKGKPWLVPLILVAAFALLFFNPFGRSGSDKDKNNDAATVDYVAKYKDATPVDPFEELEIAFIGDSGWGRLTLSNPSVNPFVRGCSFYASKNEEISNGDEILITIWFDESTIDLYGYAPSVTEKTIVVSGLAEGYVETYKDIPQEFVDAAVEYQLAQMQNYMDVQKQLLGDEGFDGPYCFGRFFQDAINRPDSNLALIVGYSYPYLNGDIAIHYSVIQYKDLKVDETGKVINDLAVYSKPSILGAEDYVDIVNSLFEMEGYVTVSLD